MAITINGTGTITGLTAGGLPDGSITTDDLAANAVTAAKLGTNSFVSYAVIADVKPTSTYGGTATSGSWITRDLNTEISDPDGIVSISSNQFTLSAGSYLIVASAPACRVNAHASRLYDVTGATEVQVGTVQHSDSNLYVNTTSFVYARVSPSASNTYRIETRVNTTNNSYGLGNANTFAVNIFTIVQIYKEA